MKKLKLFSCLGLLILVMGMCIRPAFGETARESSSSASESSASSIIKTDEASVVVEKDEVIDHDFFACGDSVDIAGTVKGDVIAFGVTVDISGVVEGDVLAAGGTVNVSGTVMGNVRVAGMQISISSAVGKNVSAFGMTVTIDSASKIEGSLLCAAQTLQLRGDVGKDVWGTAEDVDIEGTVGRNVELRVESFTISKEATISGKLTYTSPNKATIGDKSRIAQKIVYKYSEPASNETTKETWKDSFSGTNIGWKLFSFITLFVVGLCLCVFFPLSMKKVSVKILTNPGLSFLAGVVTLLLVPFSFIVLCITLVGIPLAFILLLIAGLLAYVSCLFVSLVIGEKVFEATGCKNSALVWQLLVGLLLWSIITAIPVLGWFISLGGLFFGVGATVLAIKDARNG